MCSIFAGVSRNDRKYWKTAIFSIVYFARRKLLPAIFLMGSKLCMFGKPFGHWVVFGYSLRRISRGAYQFNPRGKNPTLLVWHIPWWLEPNNQCEKVPAKWIRFLLWRHLQGVNLTDKLPKFVKKLFLWKIVIKMRQLYELKLDQG